MQIYAFSGFRKRRRSTKRPSEGAGVPLNVTLKHDTSVVNPTFTLRGSLSSNYNYVYVPQWGGYYFVTDIVSVANNLFELVCSMDALATLKNDILNSSQYVLYDSEPNTEIIDTRLSQRTSATIATTSVAFPMFNKAGYLALGINGEGSVGYYAFASNDAGIQRLTAGFDDWLTAQKTSDFVENIGLMFSQFCNSGAIAENIKCAYWLPFEFEGSTSDLTIIKLGNFETTVSGVYISQKTVVRTTNISIPWQFNDWRNSSACTNVYLYIPFVGLVSYSASELKGRSTLTVTVSRDQVIGDVCIEVKAGSQVLGTYGASVGVPFPIGSSNISGAQLMNGFASATMGAVSLGSGNVAGGAIQIMEGIMSMATPVNSVIGGVGSGAGVELDMSLICFTVAHGTNVEPNSIVDIMGTPTMKYKALAGESGYVQTSGATLDCANFGDVKTEVENLLNGGVYIE